MLALVGSVAALCYLVTVAAFRVSTCELLPRRSGGVGCDVPLGALVAGLAAVEFVAASSWQVSHGWSQLLNAALALGLFVRVHLTHVRGPRHELKDLSDTLAIVTGANTGIGLETCRELVRMGATVVMACRSESRAIAARAEIVRSAGVGPERLPFIRLDLSSMASVGAFCENFCAQFPEGRLDLLVNNAGMMTPDLTLTDDGIELTMAANHFGHFLLTTNLLV